MYGYKNGSSIFDVKSWQYIQSSGRELFENGTISKNDVNRYNNIEAFILKTPYGNLAGK